MSRRELVQPVVRISFFIFGAIVCRILFVDETGVFITVDFLVRAARDDIAAAAVYALIVLGSDGRRPRDLR